MTAVQAIVWELRCDQCGFTDYQAPKVASARHLARLDGWTQMKPTADATKSRIDFCPECTHERRTRSAVSVARGDDFEAPVVSVDRRTP